MHGSGNLTALLFATEGEKGGVASQTATPIIASSGVIHAKGCHNGIKSPTALARARLKCKEGQIKKIGAWQLPTEIVFPTVRATASSAAEDLMWEKWITNAAVVKQLRRSFREAKSSHM